MPTSSKGSRRSTAAEVNKAIETEAITPSSEPGKSPYNSQASDAAADVGQLFQQMNESKNKRRERKRRLFEAEKQKLVSDTMADITNLEEEFTTKLSELRKQEIEKLQRLAERQANIEVDISKCTKTLQKAYAATNHEFHTILQGRAEDLRTDE